VRFCRWPGLAFRSAAEGDEAGLWDQLEA